MTAAPVQNAAMDADELAMFTESVRAAVAGADAAGGAAVDAALDAVGWLEAVQAAPRDAVAAVAGALGAAAATSSTTHRVVALALTGSPDAPPALLPPLGSGDPPGRVVEGAVVVAGLANAAAIARGALTVPVAGEDDPTPPGRAGHLVVAVADLDMQPVSGLDPDAALVRVSGTVALAASGLDDAAGDWPAAVRLGRLAVAHELQGASRAILDQARTHALDRIQFDQPIAKFQAVRHRLAEALIAIETAEALLDAAWLDGTDVTASMAKAAAGRGARTVAKHGQQVLAGIGFTMEHGLHRWVRRVLVLDELLGSSRTLTKELGEALLADRQLPPLPSL